MMDAFELNKIAGAVLFALLVIFGTRTATNIIFTAHAPEKPGFEVEIAETEGGTQEGAAEEAQVPLANLLAQADAGKGESVAKKCQQCHTFEAGGANKIGPNLHNVVGRELGAVDGFAYSGALKEKGGTWDYEALSQFIADPKGFISGTKMAFPGIKRADQRADLLLYLRQQGDSPPPLPEPVAQAKPEAPAGQEGAPSAESNAPGADSGEKAPPAQDAETPAEKAPESQSGPAEPKPQQGG